MKVVDYFVNAGYVYDNKLPGVMTGLIRLGKKRRVLVSKDDRKTNKQAGTVTVGEDCRLYS